MRLVRLLPGTPELNVLLFGFLLNFPWEMWQAPLYQGMADASHRTALVRCTLAALGDVVILLGAFWAVALVERRRAWIVAPRARTLAMFVGLGLFVTVVLELAATWMDIPVLSWRYSGAMPVIPILGVGLSPMAQWIVVPLATAWLVKRQLE